jgi:hypothetical protein
MDLNSALEREKAAAVGREQDLKMQLVAMEKKHEKAVLDLEGSAQQAAVQERFRLKRDRAKLAKDKQAVADAWLQVTALRDSVEKKEGAQVKRLSATNLQLIKDKEIPGISNNGLAKKVQEYLERINRSSEEQQFQQKERASVHQATLEVLATERAAESVLAADKNKALGAAMETNRENMDREQASYEHLRMEESLESEEYIGGLEGEIEDLKAPLDINCGRGKQYELEYELFCQEGMMYASSPQQLTKIVQATFDYLQRTGQIKQGKQMKLMGVRQLERVRCDAGVTEAIMVGTEISLAKEILCITMDETGLDNVSLESTMLTLLTADQRILQYAADGVDILSDQCSETTMKSTLALEKRLQAYSSSCRSLYLKAIEEEKFPGMEEDDWDNEFLDADTSKVDQFGETKDIELGRTRTSVADHAAGATNANVRLYGTPEKPANLKSVETMERLFGKEKWEKMTPSEQRREQVVHQSGCHHHLWCIGAARGQKACHRIKAPLIKEGLEQARAKGIYMSGGGEACATIRSMLKGFGSTANQDHHSTGPEYKAHTAAKDPDSSTPFLSYGRIGKSQRQDGVEELSFMNELKRESMLDFVGEFNWAGADDINYLPATGLALGCEENEVESVLYALSFAQIRDVHRCIVASGGKSVDANQPSVDRG